LATVTFANETATGWQTQNLTTPLTIAANTTYVVSYFCSGHYAHNANYFASAITRGFITATVGGGKYVYSAASTFPQASFQNNNYWVDFTFVSGLPTPTPTPQPTYNGWIVKLNAEIATGVSPAQLLTWINSNPPTAD
jgi:hypothetical protein